MTAVGLTAALAAAGALGVVVTLLGWTYADMSVRARDWSCRRCERAWFGRRQLCPQCGGIGVRGPLPAAGRHALREDRQVTS